MFFRIISGSLQRQRRRLVVAVLAMILGSALISGLFNLSGDIGGQVGRELRVYGANLIILPRTSTAKIGSGAMAFGEVADRSSLSEVDLAGVSQVEGIVGIVSFLYGVVETEGQAALLAGADLQTAQIVLPWWQVQGDWPSAEDEVLAGMRAAEVLKLGIGDRITLQSGKQQRVVEISGILQTGGPEDDQFVSSLRFAQELTGQAQKVSLAMVSALASRRSLDQTAQEVATRLPEGAQVRALAQFARAEKTVLNKVRLLIGLVAGLVLITSALTVSGTFNIVVEERRTEIGLMKAMGAQNRRVAGLFLFEAAVIGLAGGLIGYFFGLALAIIVGRTVFASVIVPTPLGFPGTALIALAIAFLACILPVRRGLAVDPVKTLRGD